MLQSGSSLKMASGTSFSEKIPPSFDKKVDNYAKWSKKFKIWQNITEVEKKKQAGFLLLRLDEYTSESVLEAVTTDQINSDEGVQKILDHMDTLYKKDATIAAFEMVEQFENFRRPPNQPMAEFVPEFEKWWNKVKGEGTTMSDNILAYKLMKAANLSENEEQLVKASIDEIKFEEMKKILKKTFSNKTESMTSKASKLKLEDPDIPDETYFQRNNRNKGKYISYNNRPPLATKQRSYDQNYNPQRSEARSGPSRTEGKNPFRNGEITRCAICQSINHWAKHCPDRKGPYKTYQNTHEDSDSDEYDTCAENNNYDIELYQNDPIEPNKMNNLLYESMGSALIDCGATKTVCGTEWFKNFKLMLSDEERREIKYYPSDSSFKFGDGGQVKSNKKVSIPATVGNVKIKITTDIIDGNLPLLFSNKSLKKAQANICFQNDTAKILGQTVKLKMSSSGHYLLPIHKNKQIMVEAERNRRSQITLVSTELNPSQIAYKLHLQFAHPSADKLCKLVKNQPKAKEIITEIKKVTENCKTCLMFKKTPPRPIVGLPIATEFNQVVAMDLKQFGKVYLLHMIDVATKLSAGAIIRNKNPNTIVKEIFKNWIQIYGTPQKFLSDNGGEFINEQMMELCERTNITIKTTAAESPFSNGIVERHNQILGNMIIKTMEESNCSLEIAVGWCISAHNSLRNVHGFTPFQLVFGRNPTIPILQNAKPPALNPESSNEIIRQNLNALHQARKMYVESENSDKIRRALRHNIRTDSSKKYYTGQIVFYKRINNKRWRGPGTILGQDGQQVLIKHGGTYVRVHPSRVSLESEIKIKINEDQSDQKQSTDSSDSEHQTTETVTNQTNRNHKQRNEPFITDNSDSDSENKNPTTNHRTLPNLPENPLNDPIMADDSDDEPLPIPVDGSDEVPILADNTEDDTPPSPDENPRRPRNQGDKLIIPSNKPLVSPSLPSTSQAPKSKIPPEKLTKSVGRPRTKHSTEPSTPELKSGATVKVLMKNNENEQVKLYKRSGKASGKYSNEWNTITEDGKVKVIDFDRDVENWEKVNLETIQEEGEEVNTVKNTNETENSEIENNEVFFCQPDEVFYSQIFNNFTEKETLEAKLNELKSWEENEAYEEVERKDQSIISTRWVTRPKITEGKMKVKARLVLRGFEENINFRTDSPTCRRESVRILLFILSNYKWELKSIDFKTAFLQGNQIKREIYILPPKETHTDTNKIWKILKPVYGLLDAPREWYLRLRSELESLGMKVHSLDNGFFYLRSRGELVGIVISYVDDILYGGTRQFTIQIISKLKTKFTISGEQNAAFKYIGIQLKQSEDFSIVLHQSNYATTLEPMKLKNERLKNKASPLEKSEVKQLRSHAGQLNWLAGISRPDICFNLAELTAAIPQSTVETVLKMNKTIRHIRNTPSEILFPKFKSIQNLKLQVYSDASYKNLPNGASQGAHVIFLTDGERSIPIAWHSLRIKRIVRSSTASEALSLLEGCDTAYLMSKLVSEVINGKGTSIPIECITDSKNIYSAAYTDNLVSDKPLQVEMSIIREKIASKEITLKWKESTQQLANPLTKSGASSAALLQAMQEGKIN